MTIPDGQTVIVGGLKQVSDEEGFTGVPWLEHILIVRELSSLTDNEHTTTSFFLFIRPQILRDSMFRDLKYFSSQGARRAGIPGEFPRSRPLLIK